SEFFFQVRNEFFRQRVAIRAIVRRVHCVRIVVVRCRVLEGHGHHAREVAGHPGPRELVSWFPRAPAQPDFTALFVFRSGRRLSRESEWSAESEMTLNVNRRILLVRALIVPFWQEHGGAEVNRISPKLGKHFALKLYSLDP